jgi:predicted Zn-dependent protease
MKKLALYLCAVGLFLSCRTVPLTGRNQLAFIPDSELNAMSFDSYKTMLNQSKLSNNTSEANKVKTVGVRIQKAVEQYLAEKNLSDRLKGFQWEFNLVEDKTVNAFCMPGGKVVFYTGIMPICQDEAGIAVVMGHEVAHAIAGHGNERMSQGLIQQLGGVTLAAALSSKPQETQQLFNGLYGVGTQVGVLLPYGRLQESEADHLGLIFMAIAGYDPHGAPKFWERMTANAGGNAPPEFLSTHPSHQTRIQNLNKWMAEALTYYKK